MWVRGLKQGCRRESLQPRCVAPYVGAWIETSSASKALATSLSHPMWVRGLKHHGQGYRGRTEVAPYVGAWIETTCTVAVRWQAPVAPYVGAWIETSLKVHQ